MVGRIRDQLARFLLRIARNRYAAALRQRERQRRRQTFVETRCPWNGWTVCTRAGWIRDRDKYRCSGCGALVPSDSHPILVDERV